MDAVKTVIIGEKRRYEEHFYIFEQIIISYIDKIQLIIMTFQEKRTYAILLSMIGKQDENICWQIEKAGSFRLSVTKVNITGV